MKLRLPRNTLKAKTLAIVDIHSLDYLIPLHTLEEWRK
jgi:hypothetical protein